MVVVVVVATPQLLELAKQVCSVFYCISFIVSFVHWSFISLTPRVSSPHTTDRGCPGWWLPQSQISPEGDTS